MKILKFWEDSGCIAICQGNRCSAVAFKDRNENKVCLPKGELRIS